MRAKLTIIHSDWRFAAPHTFLRDWIADQQAYLRPRTWAGYKGNVDNHIIKSIGKLKLAELQPADVHCADTAQPLQSDLLLISPAEPFTTP